jgi:hypothetical protein
MSYVSLRWTIPCNWTTETDSAYNRLILSYVDSSWTVVLMILKTVLNCTKSLQMGEYVIRIYWIQFRILVTVGFWWCETWCLAWREEHGLWVFENSLLRRISGPRRDVTGGRRKQHNEELHSLYFSSSIIRMMKSRRMRLTGNIARMVDKMNVNRI